MAINQENMQNGENGNRSASGNGMNTWEMQGNGMSPMMMSRMQGEEPEGPKDLLFHSADLALVVGEIRNAQTEMERADVLKAANAPKEGASAV